MIFQIFQDFFQIFQDCFQIFQVLFQIVPDIFQVLELGMTKTAMFVIKKYEVSVIYYPIFW